MWFLSEFMGDCDKVTLCQIVTIPFFFGYGSLLGVHEGSGKEQKFQASLEVQKSGAVHLSFADDLLVSCKGELDSVRCFARESWTRLI